MNLILYLLRKKELVPQINNLLIIFFIALRRNLHRKSSQELLDISHKRLKASLILEHLQKVKWPKMIIKH